jgi:hypothetical protein
MRPGRSSAALLGVLLGIAPSLGAQTGAVPDGGGATFLLLPVGGRAAALGQAAVADGGSAEAAFWNPAGLALMSESELALHYNRTFISDNTALSAYLDARRLGVVGVSAYLVDFGSQPRTVGPGLITGQLSLKNLELLASYATELTGNVLVGVNYKLVQFRQDCSGDCGLARTVVGTTHGVDAGVQFAFGPSENFRLGMALRHAGFKLQLENADQADPLPTRVQVGVAYQVFFPRPPGVEEGLDARILLDVQDEWGQYDQPEARVGIELGVGETVRLRSGYAFLHSESSGPSVGVGFRFGRFAIDFARVFFDSSSFDEPVFLSLRATL